MAKFRCLTKWARFDLLAIRSPRVITDEFYVGQTINVEGAGAKFNGNKTVTGVSERSITVTTSHLTDTPKHPINPFALVKSETNIFGKIILGSLPNNINTNVSVNSNFAIFYDQPLDSLQGINIVILDENYMLYPLGRDFSFTLIVHEVVNILKETHIDTKRDQVVTTGYLPN